MKNGYGIKALRVTQPSTNVLRRDLPATEPKPSPNPYDYIKVPVLFRRKPDPKPEAPHE